MDFRHTADSHFDDLKYAEFQERLRFVSLLRALTEAGATEVEASYDEKRYEVDLSYIRVFGTRTEAEGTVLAKEQLTWLEETPTLRDGVEAYLESNLVSMTSKSVRKAGSQLT